MKTFLVLNILFYAKEGLTQKKICERTFQSKQTVNLIIKNLVDDNYVILSESVDDKRTKIVQMTELGRSHAERPIRHITHAEDIAMSMLSSEEQRLLIDLARRFTENLKHVVNGIEEKQ